METFSDSYELGFAAEAGWRAMHPEADAPPPWDYLAELLHMRLENIKGMCNTDKDPIIYYTSGRTFRYDIAKRKPYKGTRKENKPWHYDNLTAYFKNVLGAEEVTGIEADDALSIKHCNSNLSTILCSRDKDLKQCPGYYYSWELGRQPSWGPALITKEGTPTDSPISAERRAIQKEQLMTHINELQVKVRLLEERERIAKGGK